MKKLFTVVAISGFIMTACNDNAQKDSSAAKDSSSATTISPDTTATAAAAPVKDSLMQFKEGKVMVMVSGSWAALSAPVTTSNGRKVSPNGEVAKGGKTRKMEDGMMIDKDGQMMDKDGKMMDNTGWE